MRFDLQRAFPYPVLRPHNDDYLDGEFQTNVSFEVHEETLALKVQVNCALSVDEIAKLVEDEKACFAVVFSCRDTFLRHVERQFNKDFEIEFPSGQLKGSVEVYPFIATTSYINEFTSDLINEEWGTEPFSFEVGTILAIDEPRQVYISRDLFKPISSVFSLVKSDNVPDDEWQVTLEDHKVKIGVSPETKATIDRVRNSPHNRSVLINSIFFAAVMQCIKQLKADEEYNDYRWAQIMRQQIDLQNINLESEEEYLIAQKLMRRPLKLLSTYVFQESDSDSGPVS